MSGLWLVPLALGGAGTLFVGSMVLLGYIYESFVP